MCLLFCFSIFCLKVVILIVFSLGIVVWNVNIVWMFSFDFFSMLVWMFVKNNTQCTLKFNELCHQSQYHQKRGFSQANRTTEIFYYASWIEYGWTHVFDPRRCQTFRFNENTDAKTCSRRARKHGEESTFFEKTLRQNSIFVKNTVKDTGVNVNYYLLEKTQNHCGRVFWQPQTLRPLKYLHFISEMWD